MKEDYCPVCGGKTILIRGRHPNDDKRLVCPTCLQDRLDGILDIASRHYGKAVKR
jgi:hypothetical protein